MRTAARGSARSTRRAARRPVQPSAQVGIAAAATGAAVAQLEGLRVTHWFDSGDHGAAYRATVRFEGTLNGSRGRRPEDHFLKDEVISRVVPGSGPVSVTTTVPSLTAGMWTVTATLIGMGGGLSARPKSTVPVKARTLPRANWSWRRWSVVSGGFGPVETRWGPMARLVSTPAVVPGSWAGLVLLGVLVGLVVQTWLLAGRGISPLESVSITVIALLAGLGGAKLRYVMLHRHTWRSSPGEGWAVDGFLVVMPAVVITGLLALGIPIGMFVDASAPALFFGIAIGRVGCFLTGCCAGRPTSSRWGIWSSDRRIGARRIPAQLLEAGVGLVLAVVTLFVLVELRPGIEGLTFLAAISLYTVARRVLLRLRAER